MTRLRRMGLILSVLLFGAGSLAAEESEEKEPSAPELIAKGLKWWESVKTLRATFTRRERLKDMTELGEKQVIFLRERKDPFSIYMQWLEGPGKGRKVAYIEGQNNGKLKATPGGALGWMVVNLAPDDPEALKYSRHTVLDAGLGRLMQRLDRQFKLAGADVRSKYKGKAVFAGRPCYKFFRYMPQKPESYCWKTELLIDEELHVPVYIRLLDWERNAFEEYSYADIEVNPNYTDKHFDIRTDKD